MFSIRNAVIVALLQVAVVVYGVIEAGAMRKVFSVGHWAPPKIAALVDYGLAGLVVPLVWITAVLWLRQRQGVSGEVKNLAFWSGVVILVLLVAIIIDMTASSYFGRVPTRVIPDEN